MAAQWAADAFAFRTYPHVSCESSMHLPRLVANHGASSSIVLVRKPSPCHRETEGTAATFLSPTSDRSNW